MAGITPRLLHALVKYCEEGGNLFRGFQPPARSGNSAIPFLFRERISLLEERRLDVAHHFARRVYLPLAISLAINNCALASPSFAEYIGCPRRNTAK
jgi:hypothetical protein